MNTPRYPGFSGEASIYRNSKIFSVSADWSEWRDGRIYPALRSIETFCYPDFCCIVGEGFHYCWTIQHTPVPTR
jgi:hypothetical protein